MKNNVRQLIKTVIEENAVAFKDQTAKVLYGKIGMRLQEQYKLVAKNIISKVLHEKEDKDDADYQNMRTNEYIEDQENTQKARVKNSTKQEQSMRVQDDIAKGALLAPITAASTGLIGAGILSGLHGTVAAEPVAVGGAAALGAGTLGYMGGKAIQAGMDYFDPEQKTYAKLGAALTGGPEKIERRGAPGTQAEYSNAARTAAAARKARYGSE